MVETRRQQIENTASELFRKRGYAATSVRDIARALDMQGASLYAHMASKEDVLWSIVTEAAGQFEAATAPIAADTNASAADRLARMIRAHITVVTDDLGNASSFLYEWRFLSDERRAAIAERRHAYENCFRDLIEEGIGRGEFEPGTDPRLASTLILSAINGIATWYRPDGDLTAPAIAELYGQMLLNGLRPRAAAARTPADYATTQNAEHATGRTLR